MDRLSPLDASFLHVENAVNHMHIGSVGVFAGPAPAYGEICAMVAGKLPLLPRYRQVVRFVPFELGRPVWVDDAHFVLDYHVRHTALPPPGGEEDLRNLVGRVMSQQLDRNRPLWEMWVVEGLGEGRWAILSKVHHCMVDGVAGTDLLTVVLDRQPEPSPPPADEWRPQPAPGSLDLATSALAERAVLPYEYLRSIRSATRAPRALVTRAREVMTGMVSLLGLARRTPESSLNGAIGPHRRWAWARSGLDEVRTVRSGLGGTVNDVVLAAITRGFRDLLLSRGEPVDGRVVRTLVPVSVRSAAERGTFNNRVSAMFAELPVGIADPAERLATVRAQLEDLKERHQAVAGELLVAAGDFAPPVLLSLGTRATTRVLSSLSQRNLNTVTTNVPGPQTPLYAAGRRMLEVFPYVPLADSVRMGVAIFSYAGALTFGVTGDYDTAPDIDVLCRGIEQGVAELVKAAGAAGGAPRPGPRARTGAD